MYVFSQIHFVFVSDNFIYLLFCKHQENMKLLNSYQKDFFFVVKPTSLAWTWAAKTFFEEATLAWHVTGDLVRNSKRRSNGNLETRSLTT
jgi:hypothetical protein